MGKELRFGVYSIQNVPWDHMVGRWQYVEELGFDSVWLANHFVDFTAPSFPWFESWTMLAGLATQTSRIRIGTLVTAIPFRNPAFLARQALTVDHLSNGRLELGLGTGVLGEPSYAMTGIEDWTRLERTSRFREAVVLVDQLLRNETTTFRGRYYQVNDAVMRPGPVQTPRPPITIAANGPTMLEIAALYADTFNLIWAPGRPLDDMLKATRERVNLIEDHCKGVGRDPASLGRSLLMFRSGMNTAYDSVDAFEDEVGRFAEAGIDEFIFPFPPADDHSAVFERITTDAIPKLRRQ